MPYVLRNNDGSIVALSRQSFNIGQDEELPADNSEVQAFLSEPAKEPVKERSFLAQSDHDLSRILEDVIELLIDKNHIIFTELPQQAQIKLLSRKRARASLGSGSPMDDHDTI